LKDALPQLFNEMLLRHCISAYPQLQFFSAARNFKSLIFLKEIVAQSCISAVPRNFYGSAQK
jgi:hypothetical protein